MPRRVLLLDEVDRFSASAGTEGDPCALAIRRTESFWNAVIFLSSSPTIKSFSRIEKEFEQTDKRLWFCPCPKCGKFETLKWRQVLWGKKRLESWNASHPDSIQPLEGYPTDATDAIYECESCHAHLNDAERVKMVRAGEWRPTAPFSGKRGYHLNGIASPFRAKKGYKTRLHQMASQFLEAKAGGLETLKAWTNTFLAETWEDETSRVEPNAIMSRAEDYTPEALPDEIILGLASVDVQKRWLQVESIGLGLQDETWGIETRMIEGDPEQGEVWQDLSDFLTQKYKRKDGIEIPITATCIDMGFKPDRVISYKKSCGLERIYPVYGRGAGQGLLVSTHTSKHYLLKTHHIDTFMAKNRLFARLQVPEPGPRYLHWPNGQGYNEEYFAQLTGEVLKTQFVHGFPKQHYEKIRERNEALDIRVYLLACVDILKPNLTAIAKRLKIPVKEYQLNQPAAERGAPGVKNPVVTRRKIRVGKW